VLDQHVKKGAHLALDDVLESIEELQFYRKAILSI
jgi:oligoribonuclease (3'-5' exoribonuclease)